MAHHVLFTVVVVSLTDLIELNGVVLCAERRQQLLGGLAVWAVGLGEDSWTGIGLVDVLRQRGEMFALAYQLRCCR